VAGKELRILPSPTASEHVDPLPFEPEAGEDRSGERRALRVSDGWIVGFNDGEFGGGLWWFDPEGQSSNRIRPPVGAPVHPDDPFAAENVRGLVRVADHILVPASTLRGG
jgi:hypothetical protein